MNVVVTGGGTIAPIDDIRHIANTSTGSLSARITEACLARGATVWHIHTPAAMRPYERSACVDLRADAETENLRIAGLRRLWRAHKDRLHLRPLGIGTVDEYARQLKLVFEQNEIDVAFLAMAVSDYEPVAVPGKIASGEEPLTLTLHPTPKVIRQVRAWSPGVFQVGFKLLIDVEDAELVRRAAEACSINQSDLTVANDYRSVREGRHRILLVRPDASWEAIDPHQDIAEALVDRVFVMARDSMSAREPIELDVSDE